MRFCLKAESFVVMVLCIASDCYSVLLEVGSSNDTTLLLPDPAVQLLQFVA